MRNILILILSIFVTINIYGQSNIKQSESLEFNKMLCYFDSLNYHETRNYYTEIPKNYYYKFFQEEKSDWLQSVTPFKILNLKKTVTIIVELGYPEGGYSCSFQIGNFTKSGKLLKSKNIGFTLIDLMGGTRCYINFHKDSLLEVYTKHYSKTGEDYEIENIQSEEYEYYIINENGFHGISNSKSNNRKFPLTSYRLLSAEELERYSNMDLNIMRNEIFASYGYKFKTEKWKQYFENQDWYVPKDDYSNDNLTCIERINIEQILEVNKSKNSNNL